MIKLAKKRAKFKDELNRGMGLYLQSKRQDAGLTQKEVAMKMKLSTPQFISNIERGLSFPSDEVLKEMILLYKIKQSELLEMLGDLKIKYYKGTLF